MIIECKLTFEAAHRNTSSGATDRTARLHGHSYEVAIGVKGAVDPEVGWVMDFADVKNRAGAVIDRLDHYTLNDISGMGHSTRADVTRWIENHVRAAIPEFSHCRVTLLGDNNWSPRVNRETDGRERVSLGFAAAHYLPNLPHSHKCRRVHGHSFRIEVSGTDTRRLVVQLHDAFQLVDHRLLNEVPGLENPTSEHLALWLKRRLLSGQTPFDEIMVAETCTSCCRIAGDDD